MSVRDELFRKLTGLTDADVSSGGGGSLRGRLLAVGGASTTTKSGINLTRAAEVLKVSRRTVERWVRAADTGSGQRPSAEHAKLLATKARQAATTQAGRKATLGQSPLVQQMRAKSVVQVKVKAFQGPAAAPLPGEPLDTSYMRDRSTMVKIEGAEQIQQMLDAYAQHGDKGFLDWMQTTWGGGPGGEPVALYLSDWKFSEIDSIDFDFPTR